MNSSVFSSAPVAVQTCDDVTVARGSTAGVIEQAQSLVCKGHLSLLESLFSLEDYQGPTVCDSGGIAGDMVWQVKN